MNVNCWRRCSRNASRSGENHQRRNPRGAEDSNLSYLSAGKTRTWTGKSSGMQREVCIVLTVSSAVSLPIISACFRLVVVTMGVRSSRKTYWGPETPPRFSFTMNFVFCTVGWDCFYCTRRSRNTRAKSLWLAILRWRSGLLQCF